MSFVNRTVFISGASRGIGKAIALRLAKAGANIVIAAKSIEENERLGGTIFSAAQEIKDAGGNALPVQMDIRDEQQIQDAVKQAVAAFGGIDMLVNNASAIQLSSTENTEAKRFDLMHAINVRGTFLMTKACLPFLKSGNNPHILTLSPPINLQPQWLSGYIAYTMSKYNMTLMALGWAAEFKKYGIASNALWPRTTIATAAVKNLLGGEALIKKSRKPEIVSDAAFLILDKPAADCTGNTFIDEEVLQAAGTNNFDQYAVHPGAALYPDLFI